jgi:DNA-binding MarR family transcriptional regulator
MTESPADLIHGEYAPAFFGLMATRVTDRILEQAGPAMAAAGLTVPARATSSLLLLARRPMTVTEIAEALGYTHAALIKLTRVLIEAGLAERGEDETDARRKPISLTAAGREEARRADAFMRRAGAVYSALFEEIGVDVFDGLARMDAALAKQDFSSRLEAFSREL